MPTFSQSTTAAPDYYSDMLVGEGHYIVDRQVNESLTLSAGQVMVKDSVSGYWRASNFPTDSEDTIDGIGVLLQDVTTGVGERPLMPICQMGGVKAASLTGLPTGFGVGNHLGLLILE